MKLGLGTVEFAAKTGRHALRVPLEEAEAILRRAADAGIRVLDTAAQAGNSEEVLGQCLWPEHPFRILIRGPHLDTDVIHAHHADQVEVAVQQSLARLGQDQADAVFVGVEDGLLLPGSDKVIQRLESLREQGLVRRIGVTVSGAAEINQVFARFSPQIVQLPFNVLDQRLWRAGHLKTLKEAGIEIHVRDVFLQGILIDPMHLHPWFWPIRKHFESYHDYLVAEGLTPMEAALGFVTSTPEVDVALIGVQSLGQLDEMIAASAPQLPPAEFARFACADPRFIDPRLWNLYE